MTEREEQCSVLVIEFCRKHFRNLGVEQFAARLGARSEDVAIAACYAAFDLASLHKGNDRVAGIEFARTAIDVIERSLLSGETLQ